MDELRAAADRGRITAARDRACAQMAELTGTFKALLSTTAVAAIPNADSVSITVLSRPRAL